MRTMRIPHRTVIGVALLYANAMLVAETMAEPRPVSPSWKTPDGVAVMVAGDDLCLAPDAISEGIPPAVRSDPAMVKDLTALMDRLCGVLATSTLRSPARHCLKKQSSLGFRYAQAALGPLR